MKSSDTRPSYVDLARVGVMLIALLVLAACGFQPRGQSLQTQGLPDKIAITGERINTPLHRALRRQITAAGSTLVDQPEEADTVMNIGARNSGSRVLSVDSQNRAVEFELIESARLSSTNRDGRPGIAGVTLSVERILLRPPENQLADDGDQREDMLIDLASQMLRRLAANR
jgi:outer membrane lipopolysaccharide assembly protein LptE/RlpB